MAYDDGSRQFSVRLKLVVKAHDTEKAKQIVYARVLEALQSWIVEESAPPYPAGTLLHWTMDAAKVDR